MAEPGTPLTNAALRSSSARKCCTQKVPAEKAVREQLRALARERVRQQTLVPPLTLEELRLHAQEVIRVAQADSDLLDYATVLVGNETWRDTLAAIPFDRRVLLLPYCLRPRGTCPAPMDEIGLLCQECGGCTLGTFQATAEALGYVVLIAEGTTVVTRLLEQGQVDAVIGVSCLHVLERAFPHAAAHAIPGIAIPLHRDGCQATGVDEDWVHEAIQLRAPTGWAGRVDIDQVRKEVESWFEVEQLRKLLGATETFTEQSALEWLAKGGKRWRPLLVACVYQTLSGAGEHEQFPEAVRKVAVAVECFHKASLLHDDIEDGDEFRYGEPTPARRHGVPIALNLGDLLIGEGYRLLADSGLAPAQQARMLKVASEAHRNLCLGQGAELCRAGEKVELTTRQVLDVFRQKTSPAFEVALRLGAICAGADESTEASLKRFSDALGIAFQIRDDLDDTFCAKEPSRAEHGASIVAALACEYADEPQRQRLREGLSPQADSEAQRELLREVCIALRIEEKARQLLEHHRNEAIRSLSDLQNSHLKGLLRRLVGRVLDPSPA